MGRNGDLRRASLPDALVDVQVLRGANGGGGAVVDGAPINFCLPWLQCCN
jgi:hypothetical protein